jgi:hypothetical protein
MSTVELVLSAVEGCGTGIFLRASLPGKQTQWAIRCLIAARRAELLSPPRQRWVSLAPGKNKRNVIRYRRVVAARRAELLSPPRQRWVSLFHSSSTVGAAQRIIQARSACGYAWISTTIRNNTRLEDRGIIIVLSAVQFFYVHNLSAAGATTG